MDKKSKKIVDDALQKSKSGKYNLLIDISHGRIMKVWAYIDPDRVKAWK